MRGADLAQWGWRCVEVGPRREEEKKKMWWWMMWSREETMIVRIEANASRREELGMLRFKAEALRGEGKDESIKCSCFIVVRTDDEGMNKVKLKWKQMMGGQSEKKIMKNLPIFLHALTMPLLIPNCRRSWGWLVRHKEKKREGAVFALALISWGGAPYWRRLTQLALTQPAEKCAHGSPVYWNCEVLNRYVCFIYARKRIRYLEVN